MNVNRQYKDTVFTLLFSDPDVLRELYGAIGGVTLPPETPVDVNTLEGVLSKTFLNDVSFLVDNKLIVLTEHQSTVNPNMALRMLQYIARLYELLTVGKKQYGKTKLAIPVPEFFVLYNGTEPYPDEKILKLSDLFADTASLGIPQDRQPSLELTVKVININSGHSRTVVSRCKMLHEYSIFIAKARECEAEAIAAAGRPTSRLTEDEGLAAMRKAIDWCTANNILKALLESHRAEVERMLFSEWNLEDALVVEREEGREEGMEEGVIKGREEERKTVARTALAEGMSFDIIRKLTGLDAQTIENLSVSVGN